MRQMRKIGKSGKLSVGMLETAVLAIVLLVVLLKLYAELVPEAQDAGTALCDTGAPLNTLFSSDGVVFVIIMAALLIVIVTSFIGGFRGKK